MAGSTHGVEAIAGMLAEAFVDLPTAKWLVADPAERVRAVRGQFEILVEHAMDAGGVMTAGDVDAALVWFDHTRTPAAVPDYDQRLRVACGRHTDRFVHLDRIMDYHHPGEAHNYLALVGVRKERRGRGLATDLLRRHHRVLDESKTPAYLEAVSPETVELYGSLGFRPHSKPFHLDEGGPALYPMWRQPGRSGR